MPEVTQVLLESAVRDVVISNAYIVPDGEALDWLRGQVERGVRYRILTNSLASHDVPAVNAHYKQWRRDFIEAGVELYETRPDAAVRSEEHTSELQSLMRTSYAVFCLNKKNNTNTIHERK